jgi:hypothetical protein
MIRPHGETDPSVTESGQADLDWPAVDPEIVATLMQSATQLFGGKASIKKARDPEYPSDKYYVLRIETELSPENVVRAESQWIDGLLDAAPGCHSIRLLIVSAK